MTDQSDKKPREFRIVQRWRGGQTVFLPQYQDDHHDQWYEFDEVSDMGFNGVQEAREYIRVYGSGETIVFRAVQGPICSMCRGEFTESSLARRDICRDCEMGNRPDSYGRY